MGNTLKIIANGLETEIPEGTTVMQLLDILEEPSKPDMIVEMNYPAARHGVSKARQQHETISKQASGYVPAGQSTDGSSMQNFMNQRF
jgi:sulfur carrier protein ThiS